MVEYKKIRSRGNKRTKKVNMLGKIICAIVIVFLLAYGVMATVGARRLKMQINVYANQLQSLSKSLDNYKNVCEKSSEELRKELLQCYAGSNTKG